MKNNNNFFTLLLSCILSFSFGCQKQTDKTPVILISDLYHPHQDIDDHFDLAALYSVKGFDIKAVIIDYAMPEKNPGIIPVKQLNYIYDRNTGAYRGLKAKLKYPSDKALDQKEFQEGCDKILNVLRESEKKVIIFSLGSLRDLAAAFNRDSALFAAKVSKVVIFAGEASDSNFTEYNVGLDTAAYTRVMNSMPGLYWVPCFDGGLWKNNGKASFWRGHHRDLLKNASPLQLTYFLYCLTNNPDTTNYISFLEEPVNQTDYKNYISGDSVPERSLWCCSVFPYFDSDNFEASGFPFAFFAYTLMSDKNGNISKNTSGNIIMTFKITDPENYSKRMNSIFAELINLK
jgi:hypothetical protein